MRQELACAFRIEQSRWRVVPNLDCKLRHDGFDHRIANKKLRNDLDASGIGPQFVVTDASGGVSIEAHDGSSTHGSSGHRTNHLDGRFFGMAARLGAHRKAGSARAGSCPPRWCFRGCVCVGGAPSREQSQGRRALSCPRTSSWRPTAHLASGECKSKTMG